MQLIGPETAKRNPIHKIIWSMYNIIVIFHSFSFCALNTWCNMIRTWNLGIHVSKLQDQALGYQSDFIFKRLAYEGKFTSKFTDPEKVTQLVSKPLCYDLRIANNKSARLHFYILRGSCILNYNNNSNCLDIGINTCSSM